MYVSFYFHSTDLLLKMYWQSTCMLLMILLPFYWSKHTYMASSQLLISAEKFATENYSQVWVSFVVVRPHRTSSDHCRERESRPTGKVRVWGCLTPPNLLEPLSRRRKQAYREGLKEFDVVWLYQTFFNHWDKGVGRPTGKVWVSSGQFDHTKPLRTTVTKREARPTGKVRVRSGHSNCSLKDNLKEAKRS